MPGAKSPGRPKSKRKTNRLNIPFPGLKWPDFRRGIGPATRFDFAEIDVDLTQANGNAVLQFVKLAVAVTGPGV